MRLAPRTGCRGAFRAYLGFGASMRINRPVFGAIGSVLAVFGHLAQSVGLLGPQPRELGHFFRKTTVSRAGRPKSGLRGHFSQVPPPGFGGFHTLLRPQSASSTPYRLRGAFRAHLGSLRAKTARSRKTAVSWAGLPESGFRAHFSGVPPPGLRYGRFPEKNG